MEKRAEGEVFMNTLNVKNEERIPITTCFAAIFGWNRPAWLSILALIVGFQAASAQEPWTALGSGVGGVQYARVHSLAVSGTDVYAGGLFTTAGGVAAANIAKWNGTSWTALGSGMNGPVYSLAVSGTDVYVGGNFTMAGGVSAICIAKWNGTSWSALGSGMNGGVHSLAVSGTVVYAGGRFTTAGGVAALNIAKWNGSSWSALGPGLGHLDSHRVYSLVVSGTDVYAGGNFWSILGDRIDRNNIAKWNGSSWSECDQGVVDYWGSVNGLAVLGTDVYVGGGFTNASGVSANAIAKWNGSSWSALGSGMNGTVFPLGVLGTDVYVGGGFTTAGGVSANAIAKWDGSSWSPLGSGLNAVVRALAVDKASGKIYVGGDFSTAGGISASLIACLTVVPTLRIDIISPVADQVFTRPATVAIEAVPVVAANRTVDRVMFYSNGILLGMDETAPYEYTWVDPIDSDYRLTAKVYDDQGAMAESTPVNIKVRKQFQIHSVNPSNTECNVFWDDPDIGALFTDAVDSNTVNNSTVLIAYNPGTENWRIPGRFSVADNTVNFTPDQELKSEGRKVMVTFKGGLDGVKSKSGQTLADDYQWSFYTMPTVTVQVIPEQVVPDVNLVAKKDTVLRVKAEWATGNKRLQYSEVMSVTGDVEIIHDDGQRFVDDHTWYRLDDDAALNDGSIPGYSCLAGNSANFFSKKLQMPYYLYSIPGAYQVQATISLFDARGRAKNFSTRTTVNVKKYKSPWYTSSPYYRVHFIAVNVGDWSDQVGVTKPEAAQLVNEQGEWIERLLPAPVRISRNTMVANINQRLEPTPTESEFTRNFWLEGLAGTLSTINYWSRDAIVGIVPGSFLQELNLPCAQQGSLIRGEVGLSSVIVGTGNPAQITAHELMHLIAFGDDHSEDGGKIEGFDPVRGQLKRSGKIGTVADIMTDSICGYLEPEKQVWAYPATYIRLMEQMVDGGSGSAKSQHLLAAPSSVNGYVIDGQIMIDPPVSTATIFSVFAGPIASVTPDNAAGGYSLETQQADGSILQLTRFNPNLSTYEGGRAHGVFRIAIAQNPLITRVVVRKNGVILV